MLLSGGGGALPICTYLHGNIRHTRRVAQRYCELFNHRRSPIKPKRHRATTLDTAFSSVSRRGDGTQHDSAWTKLTPLTARTLHTSVCRLNSEITHGTAHGATGYIYAVRSSYCAAIRRSPFRSPFPSDDPVIHSVSEETSTRNQLRRRFAATPHPSRGDGPETRRETLARGMSPSC